MQALRARWKTPAGGARRDRIVSGLANGAWRTHAVWDPDGDARADLRGITLQLDLRGCDLADVRLDHAVLDGADISGATLLRASLSGASLVRTRAIEVDAFAATFYGARVDQAVWTRAILSAANCARASFRRTLLRGADLRGASFFGAELLGCNMEGARLDGADTDDALIVGCRGHQKCRYEIDLMDATSPTFAPLLRLHMELMRSLSVRAQTVALGCIHGSGDLAQIRALLLADNWRVTLAGVAATIVIGPAEASIDLIWDLLARGSWVAPQLACAASLLDPRFSDRARAFLSPSYTRIDKIAGRRPPPLPPVKSRVSVLGLLEKDALPADVEATSEEALARRSAQGWLERTTKQLLPDVRERIERQKHALNREAK